MIDFDRHISHKIHTIHGGFREIRGYPYFHAWRLMTTYYWVL
jgi:hypothetical protein